MPNASKLLAILLWGSVLILRFPMSIARTNHGNLALLHGDSTAAQRLLAPQCESPGLGAVRCLRMAVMNGNSETAHAVASDALQTSPDMLAMWLAQQTGRFLDEGFIEKAVQTADVLMAYYSPQTPPDVFNEIGLILAKAGEDQRAFEAFRKSSELEAGKMFNYGWSYGVALHFETGEWQKVIDIVEPVSDHPDGPSNAAWESALYLLALSYGRVGQLGEMDQTYMDLAAVYPQSRNWPVFQAFLHIGRKAMREGEPTLAAERLATAYDLALYVMPSARAEYELTAWEQIKELASMAMGESQMQQLLRHVHSLCVSNPSSAGCQFLLGRLYKEMGSSDQAQVSYREACQLIGSDPKSSSIYMMRQPECAHD